MSRKNFNKPEIKANKGTEKKETVNSKSEEITKSAGKYWEKKYEKEKPELIFGNSQFIVMLVGMALLLVGFFLMSGGSLPDDKWDTGVIYSFTRITLAPFIVLVGLATIGYAIFYKGNAVTEPKVEEEVEKQ
jgi:hypothetical protein